MIFAANKEEEYVYTTISTTKKDNTFKTTLRENVTGMRQIIYLPGNKLNKLITYSFLFTFNVK